MTARPLTTVGIGVLALSAALTVAGTALPWVREREPLPPTAGATPVYFTQIGLQLANGWLVALAGVLVAALAVLAALRPARWPQWSLLVPLLLGGVAAGYWLAALGGDRLPAPAGITLSVVGLVVAVPGGAILYPARLAGRLALAAVLLVGVGLALLLGVGVFALAPVSTRVF